MTLPASAKAKRLFMPRQITLFKKLASFTGRFPVYIQVKVDFQDEYYLFTSTGQEMLPIEDMVRLYLDTDGS